MSSDLHLFKFEGDDIQAVIKDGDPWFVARDVCEILGIKTEQTRRLDDDEKSLQEFKTDGGIQKMSIVSESGLYALILRSNKPEAKKFRKWITRDILPTLRKTGRYCLKNARVQLPSGKRVLVTDAIENDKKTATAYVNCLLRDFNESMNWVWKLDAEKEKLSSDNFKLQNEIARLKKKINDLIET